MKTKDLACGCTVEITPTDCWIIISKSDNCIDPNHKEPKERFEINKLFNKSLKDKNIIFIIGSPATGKTELANQIENIDEIIDDFNFIPFGNSYLDNQVKILDKLSQAKDTNKRYVVILTGRVIPEFSIINNSHIAWIFTKITNEVIDYYSNIIPLVDLEKNNLFFSQMVISKEQARPYLLCYYSKKHLRVNYRIFHKNTPEDMKNISDKTLEEFK